MHQKALYIILLLILTIGSYAQAPDLSRMDIVEKSVPDGPVALVLGTPISREEFLSRYHLELLEYIATTGKKNPSDEERVKLAIRCITTLAEREILYQEALKRKCTASEDEVKKAINEQLKDIQDNARSAGKNPPTLEEYLKIRGETLETLRERTRKNIILEKMKQALANEKKITISDNEVKSFYENNQQLFMKPSRVHLQQIFKQPKPNAKTATETAWEETKKEVEKALARIRAGESFEAVARSMSESPDREKGGDMGWLPDEALPPFLKEVLPSMKPEDLSPVLKSNMGYHLFKLLERETEEKVEFETVKDKIKQIILEQKLDEEIYNFCNPYLNDPEKSKFFIAFDSILKRIIESETKKVPEPKPAPTKTTPKKKSK